MSSVRRKSDMRNTATLHSGGQRSRSRRRRKRSDLSSGATKTTLTSQTRVIAADWIDRRRRKRSLRDSSRSPATLHPLHHCGTHSAERHLLQTWQNTTIHQMITLLPTGSLLKEQESKAGEEGLMKLAERRCELMRKVNEKWADLDR